MDVTARAKARSDVRRIRARQAAIRPGGRPEWTGDNDDQPPPDDELDDLSHGPTG